MNRKCSASSYRCQPKRRHQHDGGGCGKQSPFMSNRRRYQRHEQKETIEILIRERERESVLTMANDRQGVTALLSRETTLNE
jgi:hypothetical protein